jgi:hypothetical protein
MRSVPARDPAGVLKVAEGEATLLCHRYAFPLNSYHAQLKMSQKIPLREKDGGWSHRLAGELRSEF